MNLTRDLEKEVKTQLLDLKQQRIYYQQTQGCNRYDKTMCKR